LISVPSWWRRIALWSFQCIAAGVLCWVVFRNIDLQRLASVLHNANYVFFFLAIIPLFIERIVRPFRLATLLGLSSSSLWVVVAAQNVSQLVNMILPMRSGEMLLIVLLRALTPVAGSYAISIVIVDRLLDVIFVLLMFGLALLVVPPLPSIANQAALLLTVVCLVIIAALLILVTARVRMTALISRLLDRIAGSRGERLKKRITSIIDGFAVVRDTRRLAIALATTAVTWSLATLATWLVLKGIWPTAPLAAAALAVCFGTIGVTLISVPAGIGITHAAYALGVVVFGAPQEVGLAFAILAHFFATAVTVIMGLFGVPVAKRAGSQVWKGIR
jgi:uncharacterized protein (TIRG00374 family)